LPNKYFFLPRKLNPLIVTQSQLTTVRFLAKYLAMSLFYVQIALNIVDLAKKNAPLADLLASM
jgi:hypothetical protein